MADQRLRSRVEREDEIADPQDHQSTSKNEEQGGAYEREIDLKDEGGRETETIAGNI